MVAEGDGLNGIALSKLVNAPCRVIDMGSKERITAADIDQALPKHGEFILLKTKNSLDETFNPNFAYLDATGARSLAKAQIAGVGIDALGIEREQPDHETHLTLLKSGIVIIEGLARTRQTRKLPTDGTTTIYPWNRWVPLQSYPDPNLEPMNNLRGT